ncbi:MAG: 50S ribosomal protein L30 [Gemmatimonadales bacterium]|nr:MAG: 50S ribosomal protein L30 [Gemmatimonadales bacterium]
MSESTSKLSIKQVRSLSGRPEKHRRTMRALGFTKNQQTRIHTDTPAIRGMLEQVSHLVEVRPVEEQ